MTTRASATASANDSRVVPPGGVVIVVDDAASEEFSAPAGDVERLLHVFSALVCLPDATSHRRRRRRTP